MRTLTILAFSVLATACGGGGGSGSAGSAAPPPTPATAGLARTARGDYQGTDRGSTWSFLGI